MSERENKELSSSPREISDEVEKVMNEIFESEADSNKIDSPFDDSDADPDFSLPTCSDMPQVVFNKNTYVSSLIPESVASDSTVSVPTPTRKRKRQVLKWKRNVAKRERNKGNEYINQRGVLQPRRTIKSVCGDACNHKCKTNFSAEDRQTIFAAFWNLNDNAKLNFYSKFTFKKTTARKRTIKEISRRTDTYQYFFEKNCIQIEVCKVFFLNTLDISQNRIYYYYKTKHDQNVGVSSSVTQGKHVKFQTPEFQLDKVREHIQQFPVMESHYCRANSAKQYLDPGLNLTKMYNLYKSHIDNPIKMNIYSKVFNEEFNYAFHHPKKDQCDRCVEFHLLKTPSEREKDLFTKHRTAHQQAKLERDKDRINLDDNTAVICYDLQNVFALPKANVSSFFYKRKFNVYNLTGHCNKNKVTYCAVWHEALSGRTGNDIASALVKIIVNALEDNPLVTKLILWSDSCIPQNKNRITSLALTKLLENNQQLIQIEQTFSEPGHSQIQEIDAVHSTIERNLKNLEIYSPVSLLRHIKSIKSNKVCLKLIQLKPADFRNYNAASVSLNFPPFLSVKHLLYEIQNLNQLKYRKGFTEEFISINLLLKKTRKKKTPNLAELPTPKDVGQFNYKINPAKLKDLQSMLNFMPVIDQAFYRVYLK